MDVYLSQLLGGSNQNLIISLSKVSINKLNESEGDDEIEEAGQTNLIRILYLLCRCKLWGPLIG